MNKRKLYGILLIVLPIPTLIVVLAGYAISNFVITAILMGEGGAGGDLTVTIGRLIGVVLSLIGIPTLLGIIIGMPVGIYLLVTSKGGKKEVKEAEGVTADVEEVEEGEVADAEETAEEESAEVEEIEVPEEGLDMDAK